MSERQAGKPMRRPTMDDVAARAGVSQMTVSRVMRGTGSASADVVKRVRAAAAELGYVHNRIAGGLAGDRSNLVGVILPTLKNRVFTEVFEGVAEGLGESGAQPLFAVSEYDQSKETQLVRDLLSWRPMGLIITGLEHAVQTRRMLRPAGVRLAEIMDVDGDPMSACYGFSHRRAGSEMARRLLEQGYRRFSYVGARIDYDLRAAKRRTGFLQTVLDAGGQLVSERVSEEPSSMMLGRALSAELLAGADRPELIYYSNDDLAAGGLMHCLAEGLSIPGDAALASFNGLAFLEALPLQITTTWTPRRAIGRAAALHMTSSEAAATLDLGFEVLLGQTT